MEVFFVALVSIYTVGWLKQAYDHPASREFFEVGNDIYLQASSSGQLIDVFSSNRVTFPKELVEEEGFPIITLTVWKSLQSLYEFTYTGKHRKALQDRKKWMLPYKEKHLPYVLWWSERVSDVSWNEAFKRYNYYIQQGPTPYAFDFKHAFDDKGEICMVK